MVIDTKPYRAAMRHYRLTHELEDEPGFVVDSHLPLSGPASRLLEREQKHMHAQKKLAERWIDGHLNAPTRKILIPPLPPLTMADKAVKAAMRELGVHEEPWGSNAGPRVHWYQESTGAFNTYWCASFFWKMWQQAGYTGHTSAGAWDTTDHYGQRLTLAQFVPGCGVSFNIGTGHIGIGLAIIGNQVKSLDGNTSDEVAIRLRPVSEIHSICLPHN